MHLAVLKKPAREQSAIEMVKHRRSKRTGGSMVRLQPVAPPAAAQNIKKIAIGAHRAALTHELS